MGPDTLSITHGIIYMHTRKGGPEIIHYMDTRINIMGNERTHTRCGDEKGGPLKWHV